MPNARAESLRRAGTHGPLRVGPADVGARVVLRRVDGDALSDVVGDLMSWDEAGVCVRRRSGELVTFDADAVVSGKRVP